MPRYRTRPLWPVERAAHDDFWESYLAEAKAAESVAAINAAWDRYTARLAGLSIIPTLAGYRVQITADAAGEPVDPADICRAAVSTSKNFLVTD